MTSEVVVMNKLGLSMAADSAITSARDGVQKVYNTANKLYSLSQNQPVGIMVYGAGSFMEVPWDIIIKSFRDKLKEEKFQYLDGYVQAFIKFLTNDERFNQQEVERIIVYRTFSDHLKRIVNEVEIKMSEQQEGESKEVNRLMEKEVKSKLALYQEKTEIYLHIKYHDFKEKFTPVIREVIEEFINYEIPSELDELLFNLAFELMRKDYFSVGSSGIVMAGYGEQEIFPHLLNYRLEGFLFGQLKYKKLKEKRISYTNDSADGTSSITAFAQREMVDSFVEGIEPNMEEAMFGIIDKVLADYHLQIQKHLNIDFSEDEVKRLKDMGNELYQSIADTVEAYKQNHYIYPLLGVVRSLPKEELAEMTETLVNLTSFKRRVTRAAESVGPPVDVAVITKGDGFVWVKRKTYIKPEINDPF